MSMVRNSGVRISSKGTAREMKPSETRGVIGGTTTICAQQQRQPSPDPPSLESEVLWLEKMHESGEISWHAKISVAAISRTKSVTTRRVVDHRAIEPMHNMMPRTPTLAHLAVDHQPPDKNPRKKSSDRGRATQTESHGAVFEECSDPNPCNRRTSRYTGLDRFREPS